MSRRSSKRSFSKGSLDAHVWQLASRTPSTHTGDMPPSETPRASDRRAFALTLLILGLGLFVWGVVLGTDGITFTGIASPGVILVVGALAFAGGSHLLGRENH